MQVLGVSFDTVEENAAFVKAETFPFPILCDVDRAMGLAYGAADDAKAGYAKRLTYVISPEGKIEQAIANVKVKTHAQTVLDIVESIGSKPIGEIVEGQLRFPLVVLDKHKYIFHTKNHHACQIVEMEEQSIAKACSIQ